MHRHVSVLILLLSVAGATALVAQQPEQGDTLLAIQAARAAGSESPVGSYFLAGVVAAPLAAGSVIALAQGEPPRPWMALGPVLFGVTTARGSRSNLPLPAAIANTLTHADSAYAAVFRRTYDETLRRRRRTAFGIGSLTGIVAAVLLLPYALGD